MNRPGELLRLERAECCPETPTSGVLIRSMGVWFPVADAPAMGLDVEGIPAEAIAVVCLGCRRWVALAAEVPVDLEQLLVWGDELASLREVLYRTRR